MGFEFSELYIHYTTKHIHLNRISMLGFNIAPRVHSVYFVYHHQSSYLPHSTLLPYRLTKRPNLTYILILFSQNDWLCADANRDELEIVHGLGRGNAGAGILYIL